MSVVQICSVVVVVLGIIVVNSLRQRLAECLRLLSLCLGYLRTTATKADYERACRLMGKVPYEQSTETTKPQL